MNVFIIGGDGYIGAHICKKFVRLGHAVTVFGPPMHEGLLEEIQTEIVRMEGDMQNPHQLFEALLTAKPAIIVHLAAFGSGKDGLTKSANDFPKQALDVNVMGFYNVLESARVLGIPRIVWSSSGVVYGFQDQYSDLYVNERDVVLPSTFYGSTKVMNELTARYYRNQYGMEITGLRLPLILGPGKWYRGAAASITSIFEQCSSSGEVTTQAIGERLDLMYVKDVAELFYHVSLTDKPLSDIYNVSGYSASVQEMADHVMQLVPGYRVSVKTQSSDSVYPLMDASRIQRELGYVPGYSGYEVCKDYLKELGRI